MEFRVFSNSKAQTCHLRSCTLNVLVVLFALGIFESAVFGIVAIGPGGSNTQVVHSLGYTGTGIRVGIISGSNARVTHEAFYDKDASGLPMGSSHAFWHDATTTGSGTYYTGTTGHDTWIAGIIASRGGLAYPDEIGAAPGVDIFSERVATIEGGISSTYIENALNNLVNQNCRVIFTGFQINPADVTPDGASLWTRIYDYYADTYNLVLVNAAGNKHDGNGNLVANNVTVFGDAYNGITTGGLDVVEPSVWRKVGIESLPGYTADERRKPELVAPSQNQTMPNSSSDTSWFTWTLAGGHTSLAAPHATGVAALLLNYADSTADADDGQNEVIRAVMVNSAFPNIKDINGAITAGQIYDVSRGYGRVDAMRAFETLAAGRITKNSSTTASKGWAYESFPKNTTSTHTYSIFCNKNERLAATLVWNRTFLNKYTQRLFENLNLQVLDPDSILIFSDNGTKDNLKKVDMLLSKTGFYQVKVADNTSWNWVQDYAIAFERVQPIIGDFNLDYIVNYNDLYQMAEQWLSDGTALVCDLASPDSHIDFADFAILAQNWLVANNAYYDGY